MGEYARLKIMEDHGVDIGGDDVPAAFGPYGVRVSTDQSGKTVYDPRNHGKPWTDSLDAGLLRRWRTHKTVAEMATHMGRTTGSVMSRLRFLGVPCDDMGKPLPFNGSNSPTTPKAEMVVSKDSIMNVKMTHLLTLMQTGYTTVEVQFQKADAKTYTYKAPDSMGLVEGDKVVVDADGRLQVARVTEVHKEPELDFDKPYAIKWVVQRVDMTAYEDQQAREAAALSMIVKADRLKKQQEALDALLGSGTTREELTALLNSR